MDGIWVLVDELDAGVTQCAREFNVLAALEAWRHHCNPDHRAWLHALSGLTNRNVKTGVLRMWTAYAIRCQTFNTWSRFATILTVLSRPCLTSAEEVVSRAEHLESQLLLMSLDGVLTHRSSSREE